MAALDLRACGRYRLQGWLSGGALLLHRASRSETAVSLEVEARDRERVGHLEGLFVDAEVQITKVSAGSAVRGKWLGGKVHVPGNPAPQVKLIGESPCTEKADDSSR